MSNTIIDELKTATRLLSYGCSIVFGDELDDAWYGHPSSNSFSALLAKDQNIAYQCHAIQGGSNERTTRKIAEYLREFSQPDDFLIIGWTSIYRKEILIPEINAVMNFVPGFNPSINFEDMKQRKIVNEAYERYVDNITCVPQNELINDLLNKVELTYNALENSKVKFFMFQSFIDSPESFEILQRFTTNKPRFFSQITILDLVTTHEPAWVLPRYHPNNDGHKYIKETLLDHFSKTNV